MHRIEFQVHLLDLHNLPSVQFFVSIAVSSFVTKLATSSTLRLSFKPTFIIMKLITVLTGILVILLSCNLFWYKVCIIFPFIPLIFPILSCLLIARKTTSLGNFDPTFKLAKALSGALNIYFQPLLKTLQGCNNFLHF